MWQGNLDEIGQIKLWMKLLSSTKPHAYIELHLVSKYSKSGGRARRKLDKGDFFNYFKIVIFTKSLYIRFNDGTPEMAISLVIIIELVY